MNSPKPWVKEALLSLFVAFHIVCMVSCALPVNVMFNTDLHRKINSVLQSYVMTMGLWQSWSMFAPNPREYRQYLEAEIQYADGTKKIWNFPRMEKLSQWERFRLERYRKWSLDYLATGSSEKLWYYAARYIARQNNELPNNPPRSITLIRHRLDPPPFAISYRKYHGKVPLGAVQGPWLPPAWQQTRLSTYTVRPEDIR